jgi:pimeloyl-ACP methyl ester carboxylesterase
MPSVRIGDAEIYYERHGNGYPLVLSHQGFSSIENWDLNLGELSKYYEVVVYDRRGCGRSRASTGIEASAVWLEDLVGLVGALGIQQAYFGGSSYGAMLTLEVALEHPDIVKAAVLMSGTTQYFGPISANAVPFPDRRPRLTEIRCPVLILQGADDARFPPETGHEGQAAIPRWVDAGTKATRASA